ncbi:MAG: hypothetical protein P1U88_02880 [Thalassobaculaceae bacterium]|nr:hypothetical protein [Thalassobaculaceae bacterium]
MIADSIAVSFAPLVPWAVVIALGVLALLVLALGWLRSANGILWRTAALAILTLALANPTLIAERREPREDVVVVAIDRTTSQSIGDRESRTDATVAALEERLARLQGLSVKRVTVRDGGIGEATEGTRLGAAIREALSDVPQGRVAGVIAVTDGQVHDSDRLSALIDAPMHVLLTGERDEQDRRLRVAQAPSFGMVGKTVTLTVEVIDPATPRGEPVAMRLSIDGEPGPDVPVPANTEHEIELPIDHAGQTVVELSVEPGPAELTLENNRAVVGIGGVRDRLRVLLVSGAPHAGERTWRDILKSDPSVDLVHFTILRPPEKQDGTPIRELSLIAFPFRELFELKLAEFDLIIFDRYRRRGVLPRLYLRNIADYVRNGGALLEASGPTFAGRLSLARTPLGDVLPISPTGGVIEQGFKPRVTEIGQRHPVTSALAGANHDGLTDPLWGRWFRQIDGQGTRGNAVMSGVAGRPLLVLDRVGEGRVAHLLSDQIWLWSRGFEGGGPQAEVLRRTAHWLMEEPDLEEDDLRATARGRVVEIERRTLGDSFPPVRVTGPDGNDVTVELTASQPGRARGELQVDRPGLYRLTDGEQDTLVAVGALNPVELTDVATTDARLGPIADATGGSVTWLSDTAVPSMRRVAPGRTATGRGWIGLRENGDYVVAGVSLLPALPAALALTLMLGMLVLAWRREGD